MGFGGTAAWESAVQSAWMPVLRVAERLGVRPGICTLAARKLQIRGLIRISGIYGL